MADENIQNNQTTSSNGDVSPSNQEASNLNIDNTQANNPDNINQNQNYNPNSQSNYQNYNQNMNYSTNPGINYSGFSPSGGMYGQNNNQFNYQQNAYSQYGSGMYDQNYNTQGYDPYSNMYAQGYTQQGYDPSGSMYSQGYDQMGYDSYNSMYAQDNNTQNPSNPTRVNVTPNNPMRVHITPNNPATSSNNITLNLDNLDQNSNNQNRRNEEIIRNEKLKAFLVVLMENNIEIELYSTQNDEIPIALGNINMVTNQTVSVENKITAIKYISYIKFSSKYITDNKIHDFFARVNTPRQKSFEYNIISDFYNLLYSKILLNQSVNITIDASFFTEIKNVNVVNLNTEVSILKSSEFYYLIELDKIVSVE